MTFKYIIGQRKNGPKKVSSPSKFKDPFGLGLLDSGLFQSFISSDRFFGDAEEDVQNVDLDEKIYKQHMLQIMRQKENEGLQWELVGKKTSNVVIHQVSCCVFRISFTQIGKPHLPSSSNICKRKL